MYDSKKTKVLVFSTSYFPFVGGAEVAIREVAKRLSSKFDFFIITSRFKRSLPKIEKVPEGTIVRLGFGNQLDKYLLMPLGFFWALRRPGILFGLDISAGSMVPAAIKIFSPRRFFVLNIQYGYGDERLKKGRWGLMNLGFRIMLSQADSVTAISNYLLDIAKRYGYTGHSEIIPNGVEKSEIRNPKSETNSNFQNSKFKTVITVSRLVPKNGVDILIKAVVEVRKSIPDIRCLILGEGPEEKSLKNLATQLGVAGNVEFLGTIDQDKIPKYLVEADVFARPSRSEGMGNAFLEGLAAGVPIVGTNVGGIPDIIENGKTGLFCNTEDHKDLAEKILILLQNKSLSESIVFHGREMIKKRFLWEEIGKKYERIFSGANSIKVLMLSGDASVLNPISPAGQRTEEYKNVLGELEVLLCQGSFLSFFSGFWSGFKLMRRKKFDVITAQSPEHWFLAWVLSRFFKVPWQMQIHTDILNKYFWKESLKNKFRVILAKFLIPRANYIRVVSERIKNSLAVYGIQHKAILVLSIFVDTEKIKNSPIKTDLHQKHPGRFIILMVSRLTKEKNIELTIEALSSLIRANRRIVLVIVGDGPEKENLRRMAYGLGLVDSVVFEPWTDDPVSYYKTCDLFLLTSNYEGYGMTLVEAAACGAKIVSSDVGIAPEILEKENIFKVGNKDDLVQKLKLALENKIKPTKTIPIQTKEEYLRLYKKSLEFPKLFEPKIYYVANARFPTEKAHGIQMAKMIEAMIGAWVDVKVVVPKRSARDARKFYGLRHRITVKKLPVLPLYNLGKIGFWLGSISFTLGYWLFLVWKKLRGENFTIYTIDIDQFSFFAIPFIGAPYFVEVHDAKKAGFFFNLLLKKATGIIVINNLIKEIIAKEFYISPDKIIVHPNGIDLENFSNLPSKKEAREKLNLPKDAKIALYVGKFYNWKGLGILSETAKKLPDIAFYLVGGSKEELKKVSGVENWPENVVGAGHRDFKEMPLWLASADVLLLLGTKANEYSYKHTSPMKLFEYMASMRPIVASKTPAIKQIVSENEVIFYEPDSADDFANSVAYALDNVEESQKKSQNAYEKVKNFSWKNRAESVLKFINFQTKKLTS